MIGLGVGEWGGHGAGQVDATLGVGEAALLLGPHRRRQVDVRVVRRLDILVGVLDDAEPEVLERFADAWRIRHRGHGIGADHPQCLDLAGLDGREDVSLEEAPRFGE